MKINLIDSCFAHTPTGQICDFYKSNKIQWDRTLKSKNITVVTDAHIPENEGDKYVALLIEPRELVPGLYKYVEDNAHNYRAVLTHDFGLLQKEPSALPYFFGGCWIEPKDAKIHDKSKMLSITASDKRQTAGHQLRHTVVGQFRKSIDTYGRGYNPIEKKIEGLKDYRFSIVIENVAQDNFFTEKLIDCFATGTIPIYWGMPNIGQHFNSDGMFTFTTIRELAAIIELLDEGQYEKRRAAIEDNFERAKKFYAPEDNIFDSLKNAGLV